LVHGVLVSQGPFLPSLVFVGLFVFPLGGGTGQRERQTDRQTNRINTWWGLLLITVSKQTSRKWWEQEKNWPGKVLSTGDAIHAARSWSHEQLAAPEADLSQPRCADVTQHHLSCNSISLSRISQWSQSSFLRGKLLRSVLNLFYQAFVQCVQTGTGALTGLWLRDGVAHI